MQQLRVGARQGKPPADRSSSQPTAPGDAGAGLGPALSCPVLLPLPPPAASAPPHQHRAAAGGGTLGTGTPPCHPRAGFQGNFSPEASPAPQLASVCAPRPAPTAQARSPAPAAQRFVPPACCLLVVLKGNGAPLCHPQRLLPQAGSGGRGDGEPQPPSPHSAAVPRPHGPVVPLRAAGVPVQGGCSRMELCCCPTACPTACPSACPTATLTPCSAANAARVHAGAAKGCKGLVRATSCHLHRLGARSTERRREWRGEEQSGGQGRGRGGDGKAPASSGPCCP